MMLASRRAHFGGIAVLLAITACTPTSTKPASEDPERALGGVVFLASDGELKPLETGPFFLTNLMIEGESGAIFSTADPSCKEKELNLFEWPAGSGETSGLRSHHGMRLFIPKGNVLCAKAWGQARIVWAAFRP